MNTYAHISHFYWAGKVAEAGYGPGSQWLWAPLWCPLDRGIFFVNTGTKCGFIWHKTLFFFWWPSTYMVAHPCAHPELQLNAVKIDVRIGNKTIYPAEMLWGLNMIMYRKDCVSPNGPREIQFSSQGHLFPSRPGLALAPWDQMDNTKSLMTDHQVLASWVSNPRPHASRVPGKAAVWLRVT